MSRQGLRPSAAVLAAALVLAGGGCGRYGPPRRAEAGPSAQRTAPAESGQPDARGLDDDRDEETRR